MASSGIYNEDTPDRPPNQHRFGLRQTALSLGATINTDLADRG
jgi:hypothetical protein